MRRVLFAPVGDTDPVRNDFDGPILHIVRHYRPQAVYLFINKRFELLDRSKDLYARFIRLLVPDCVVEKRYSGIVDASDFDVFTASIRQVLDEITVKHPTAEILLNISSGTPQMIASICLEAVSGRYRCRPIQVKSPQKDSNAGVGHLTKDEPMEKIWENLLDNLPEAENRCVEPEIFGFRRALLTREVMGMLQTYDYQPVWQILEGNPGFFPRAAGRLAKHAWLRSSLCTAEAEQVARQLTDDDSLKLDLFPVKNMPAKKIVEYYLLFEIKRKKKELSDFVLRISPLAAELAANFLERCYKLPKTRLIIYRNGIPWYSLERMAEIDKGLVRWFESAETGVSRSAERFYNLENSLKICQYYSRVVKTHADSSILQMLEQFERLREMERNVRNLIAHEIVAASEEMIQTASGGLSSERVSLNIRNLITGIFGKEIKQEVFAVYDQINAVIKSLVS